MPRLLLALGLLCLALVAGDPDEWKEQGVFSAAEPGKWAGKEAKHAPILTVNGQQAKVITKHGASKDHHVGAHWIEDENGKILVIDTWGPDEHDEDSEFRLPAGLAGKITAYAYCNQHGVWKSEPVAVGHSEL
mmetsp:Transcript_10556/g.24813  ORF Transcript_10556/g.24813 Transcript_10556/m.24813 type:complete len:133 (+) Transcript_10556:77-475(+)|eukprot:CAMPEP_0171059360 /NCGR_PEP_ID=MMETSP0766_2-20121228/3135_1 /TAXON_ID=439317 /ORGANISM="Gambierdiscus australes, Strain CAWD 149" /LENGTH=132 /DNA_ID=CAMNT_0011514789 /DNA_START=76 /DNA_END=474 /DNA_ORIENTATION=+